jgi:TM2 domain-containing membrane protein YozV
VPPGTIPPKSKLAAGLLGIFLGAFGVHRFYLGFTTIGLIQLILGLAGIVTCGITTIASAIWGLIEGIMILTGSIATDANGVPLAD